MRATILFEQITIVGLGLIGASFAQAVKKSGLVARITGWDLPEVLAAAIDNGTIDGIEDGFADDHTPSSADLIYLAMPTLANIKFLTTHSKQFKPGALITDSSSTKRAISEAAQLLPTELYFIGGHPMAGSQLHGLAAANDHLFENCTYLLSPIGEIPRELGGRLERLICELGATPRYISADEHDIAVARISHLPQLLSTALVIVATSNQKAEFDDNRNVPNKNILQLAGQGFRDMSRLAASPWSIWQDICATNRDNIALALDDMIYTLSEMRDQFKEDRLQGVGNSFTQAQHLVKKVQ